MSEIMVLIVVIWVLFGIVYGIGMGRRGYDPWSWAALGAIFGPIVIPLAYGLRRRRPVGEPLIVHAGRTRPGLRVLVGVDGSAEGNAAGHAVVALLWDRIGELILATVIDSDAATAIHTTRGNVFERDAQKVLDEAARAAGFDNPTTLVLEGKPADALVGYAAANDVDLVVVGRRGRGLSETVLGSVAEQLVGHPEVMVLVSGERAARALDPAEIGT